MAMEYYLFITNQCNLRCSYCASRNIFEQSGHLKPTDSWLRKVVRYIDKNKQSNEKDTIVFFGGEPLLNQEYIDKFMTTASDLDLSYMIYTNGILLDSVSVDFFDKFDVVFVSVDGSKKSHDIHRGQGTYDKIMSNLTLLSTSQRRKVIGRITVEEETDLFESAVNVLQITNAVHWQVVNKPKFGNANQFIKNYSRGIDKLVEYWVNNARNGNMVNIIPIQSVIMSLFFGTSEQPSFKCGVGKLFQAIDLNGNVYWCDEYVNEEKGIIGTINNGKKPILVYESHKDLFSDCNVCEISNICLGRCKKSLKEYTANQNRIYCSMTKALVSNVKQRFDDIKVIINKYKYSLEDFNRFAEHTEEIP